MEEAMGKTSATRDTLLIWARKCAIYCIGGMGAVSALFLLLIIALLISGVLEW
jgi:hypothetical protein